MPTTHTPVIRFPKGPQITPLAVDIFEKMEHARTHSGGSARARHMRQLSALVEIAA